MSINRLQESEKRYLKNPQNSELAYAYLREYRRVHGDIREALLEAIDTCAKDTIISAYRYGNMLNIRLDNVFSSLTEDEQTLLLFQSNLPVLIDARNITLRRLSYGIKNITLSNHQMNKESLDCISQMSDLRCLSLILAKNEGKEIPYAQLATIVNSFPSLRKIHLLGDALEIQEFSRHITTIDSLKELSIDIRDAHGFSGFAEINEEQENLSNEALWNIIDKNTHLEYLRVSMEKLKNDRLQPGSLLEKCSSLKSLELSFVNISDDFNNVLRKLLKLESLTFIECSINNNVFPIYSSTSLKTLGVLDCYFNELVSSQISPVQFPEVLERLELNSVSFSFGSLIWLEKMSKLYFLDLSQSVESDKVLEKLQNHPRLEVLNLYGAKITDEICSLLLTLPALKQIDLRESGVTWRGILDLHPLRDQLDDLRFGSDGI